MGESVTATNRRCARAAARGDAREMASVYSEDAELLRPNTDAVRGREAIERFWRSELELGVCGVYSRMLRLEQLDGLAYEVGRYTMWVEPENGEPAINAGRYLLVHKRQPEGSWRRAVEIFNTDAPGPMTSGAAVRLTGNAIRQKGQNG